MKIKAKVIGDKEIADKIKLLETKASDGLKTAVTDSAIHVEKEAKHLAPVLTGRLRSSITYKVSSLENKHQATVGTSVYYAPYVEFGTRPHSAPISSRAAKKYGFPIAKGQNYIMVKVSGRPKPFLFPAFKASQSTILRFITEAINRLKV